MATVNIDSYYKQLEDYAKSKGSSVETSWRNDLARTYEGVNGAGARTSSDIFEGLKRQIDERVKPTGHRQHDSQSAEGNALYGSGSGNASNTPGGPFGGAPTPPAPSGSGPSTPSTLTAPRAANNARDYLKQLYDWYLGRTPSDDELQSHMNPAAMNSGRWNDIILQTFQNSDEYRKRAPGEIARLYQQHLGRTPSQDEINAHLGNRQGIAGIQYAIQTSDEYKKRPTPPAGPSPASVDLADPRAATTTPLAGTTMPPFQFDDAYSNLFEQIAQNQLKYLQGNPELDRLMNLISTQLEDLSTPGYSPEELALLNTQVFEPIEDLRAATRRRTNERASARGFLPTSGIADLVPAENAIGHEQMDVAFDRMRTTANRDLAVHALNRRQQDQRDALSLAQLGLQIPLQLGQQQLGIGSLLYQMPRQAMMDSLAVLAASNPTAAMNSVVSMMTALQNQQQISQQALTDIFDRVGEAYEIIVGGAR